MNRIVTQSECENAAADLGEDSTAATETSSNYPAGCYLYNGNSLWFNFDTSLSTPCSSGHPCICEDSSSEDSSSSSSDTCSAGFRALEKNYGHCSIPITTVDECKEAARQNNKEYHSTINQDFDPPGCIVCTYNCIAQGQYHFNVHSNTNSFNSQVHGICKELCSSSDFPQPLDKPSGCYYNTWYDQLKYNKCGTNFGLCGNGEDCLCIEYVALKAVGEACIADSECSSAKCLGGRCCGPKGKSEGCIACNVNGDCATCEIEKYVKQQSECFLCPDGEQCTNCNDGYYQSTEPRCVPCPLRTFTGGAGAVGEDECIQCPSNHFLLQKTNGMKECVSDCPEGMYEGNDARLVPTCKTESFESYCSSGFTCTTYPCLAGTNKDIRSGFIPTDGAIGWQYQSPIYQWKVNRRTSDFCDDQAMEIFPPFAQPTEPKYEIPFELAISQSSNGWKYFEKEYTESTDINKEDSYESAFSIDGGIELLDTLSVPLVLKPSFGVSNTKTVTETFKKNQALFYYKGTYTMYEVRIKDEEKEKISIYTPEFVKESLALPTDGIVDEYKIFLKRFGFYVAKDITYGGIVESTIKITECGKTLKEEERDELNLGVEKGFEKYGHGFSISASTTQTDIVETTITTESREETCEISVHGGEISKFIGQYGSKQNWIDSINYINAKPIKGTFDHISTAVKIVLKNEGKTDTHIEQVEEKLKYYTYHSDEFTDGRDQLFGPRPRCDWEDLETEQETCQGSGYCSLDSDNHNSDYDYGNGYGDSDTQNSCYHKRCCPINTYDECEQAALANKEIDDNNGFTTEFFDYDSDREYEDYPKGCFFNKQEEVYVFNGEMSYAPCTKNNVCICSEGKSGMFGKGVSRFSYTGTLTLFVVVCSSFLIF